MGLRRALPAVLCLAFAFRPLRFAAGVAALLAVHAMHVDSLSRSLAQERNFFGVVRVSESPDGGFHILVHGTTMHGAQRMNADRNVQNVPLMYYDPEGPIGQVMLARLERGLHAPVGVAGLGTGALAAYAEQGQELTFFEIDPAVERLARNPEYFTYLARTKGKLRVELGDARLTLAREPDGHYGLLVLDAFSSDAIPVHLLTVEALDVYLAKLAPQGVLAFHITNNYFDLSPVLARLAQERGLVAIEQQEETLTPAQYARVKRISHWVLLARDRQAFDFLGKDDRWRALTPGPDAPLWTDDFSSLWSVLRW
jgi:hypothetical protein